MKELKEKDDGVVVGEEGKPRATSNAQRKRKKIADRR